jgi:hypothetical protein
MHKLVDSIASHRTPKDFGILLNEIVLGFTGASHFALFDYPWFLRNVNLARGSE